MSTIIYIIITICLCIFLGYVLFKSLRKKADKSFEEKQKELTYIKDLKSNTIALLENFINNLPDELEEYAMLLNKKHEKLQYIPFNNIHKDIQTRKMFESIHISLLKIKDEGVVSEDNIKSLLIF